MEDRAFDEKLAFLDLEWYLDREGLEYKENMGHRGRQLNLRECPLCGGDKWKVFLNADTGLGNCFSGSCEARFNKFTFIRAHIGGGSYATVKAHVTEAVREQGWRPKKIAVKHVEADQVLSALPPSYPLPIDGKNLAYLAKRGIGADLAAYFHLRYCHQGMYLATREGKSIWQDFSQRIIIPVFDLDGELTTFQGRDITGTAEKKYKFPLGLPGTGRFLCNGHNALGARRVVLNEGPFDVIAAKIALDAEVDLRDVVPIGSFGKNLTTGSPDGNDQGRRLLQLKGRGLEEVTIMWDGEKRAYHDAIDAALRIVGLGIAACVAALPAGKDPNEVDGRVVRQAFRNATRVTRTTATKLRLSCPYR